MGNWHSLPTSLSSLNPDNASQMFAALDRTHQGSLTLRELMAASAPGLVMPHSLPALYFFDDAKDGRFAREEFAALVRFCQQEKQNVQDSICRDKAFREIITRASAAGVKDCSAPGRTSFRRFSSYSNVRSIFSRRLSTSDVQLREDNPSADFTQSLSASSSNLYAQDHPLPSEASMAHARVSFAPDAEAPASDTDSDDERSDDDNMGHFGFQIDAWDDRNPSEDMSGDHELHACDAQFDQTSRAFATAMPLLPCSPSSDSDVGEGYREKSITATNVIGDPAIPNFGVADTKDDDTDVDGTDTSDSSDCSDGHFLSPGTTAGPGPVGISGEHDSVRNGMAGPSSVNVETLAPLDAQYCTAIDAAVIERIAKMNIHKLADMLHREGSRKQFMQWLWKLIDFDCNGMITLEELRVFLEALGEDGIDLQELAFYKEAGVPLEECIINEFDTTHTGVLDQDEFMVLADLVTREYEFWESRHLERVGDYELGRTIGRGSSCVVRICVHVQTHERFAIKIIRKGKCADMGFIDREIQALKVVKHPHVVGLEEVLESDENIFLVIELCGGGSLADVLRLYPEERMPERIARFYLLQVFEATAYCHASGICHRDVRLDNVLLDNKGTVKLTDFGHSKTYTSGWDFHSTMLVGSVYNLSPEQIAGQLYSGEKIDIWSTGVAMYTLLVGHPPFFDQDTGTLLRNISTGSFEVPPFISDEAADLIRCMIRVLPNERVPLSQLLVHPWFYAGDSHGPSMDVYTIPVDVFYSTRPDLAEMIMAGTIHEHNLHFHLADALNPKSSPEDLRGQDWCLKCLSPQMDIKFSVSLFTRKPVLRGAHVGLHEEPIAGMTATPVRRLPASMSVGGNLAKSDVSLGEPGLGRSEKSFPLDLNRRCVSELYDGPDDLDLAIDRLPRERSHKHGPLASRQRHKRSKSLNGEDDGSLQALRMGLENDNDAESSHSVRSSGPFDAFPHQRVFRRKQMPEATRLFDSNRRIAAAAEAAKKLPGAPHRNIPRSFTFDTVAAYAVKGGTEKGLSAQRHWSIARTLAQHPSKAHISPVARQFASGNVSPRQAANDGRFGGYPDVPRAEESVQVASLEDSCISGANATSASSAGFQPFIEVRLQSGETGLFLRICHKLKAICDTKLAAAAEVQRQRSSGRRSASASISAFRRIASVRSIERT